MNGLALCVWSTSHAETAASLQPHPGVPLKRRHVKIFPMDYIWRKWEKEGEEAEREKQTYTRALKALENLKMLLKS